MFRAQPAAAGPWDWEALRRVSLREARRILRSPEEAEDAAQEAVMRAWRHQGSCRDPAAARGWMAAIARREALRRVSARSDPPSDADPYQPDPQALEQIEVAALRMDVERALRALAPEEQRMLELRYRADLTQGAVAAELGMPEGTVKVRLHRLRKQLQESLR